MPIDIYDPDYEVNPLEDDDRMAKIKEAIKALRPVERRILLVYTELGTYTQAAKEFHVSVPTIKRYIDEIRIKIQDYIEDDTTTITD